MKRKAGHYSAGSRRRVGTDVERRSTRRKILVAVAAWPALAWIRAVSAQSKQAPIVIGWLGMGYPDADAEYLAAFRQGLAELGWKEGSQVVIEERWARGHRERLQTLAGELASRKPTVIVAWPVVSVLAASKASPTTPIVQATGTDLVRAGLAKSLARPGGMVTGLSNMFSPDLTEKMLELLLAAVPSMRRVGFLVDPRSRASVAAVKTVRRMAERLSMAASLAEAARPEDIEPAVAKLAGEGVEGLVLLPSAVFSAERDRIVKLALKRRWPIVAGNRRWVAGGALLTYGIAPAAIFRRSAHFVDRILRGAKPGDLPIELPATFELAVNLKTARVLGLTIPASFLLRADRVIE